MELFSGRLDILTTKEDTLKHIKQFIKDYALKDQHYVVAYEEKTKSGLPCKPHIHFLYYSTFKHDGMRKDLSSYGYTGTKGSLSCVSKNPKYTQSKTYSYVMKQQEIIHTNIKKDELKELLITVKAEQQDIQEKMNSFTDHWEQQIVPTLVDKSVDDRKEILIYIHSYITGWNKANPTNKVKFPNKSSMLSFMQIYEAEFINEKEAQNRWLSDNGILF